MNYSTSGSGVDNPLFVASPEAMLLKIALVIFLRTPEGRGRDDLRHDRPIVSPAGLQFLLRGDGGISLLRRVVENR